MQKEVPFRFITNKQQVGALIIDIINTFTYDLV